MRIFIKIVTVVILIIISSTFLIWNFLGPTKKDGEIITFIVPQNKAGFNLVDELEKQNLIKNKKVSQFLYQYLYKNFEVQDGGYYLDKSDYAWQTLKKLKKDKPDLVWININFCPRKEQIGEILRNNLNWNDEDLRNWNNLNKNTDYFEGVYYPDTYLIPINETPTEVASRFISRFNQIFAPYQDKFLEKNIKWTTGIKIASLIAREAGGVEDSKIVSSVIWNRLDQDMRLQIDATMQYTLGKNINGKWWGPINLKEKQSDSPYNTYKVKGLPPTPICSPNINFIEAALNPEETECLFYLHDENKNIHCSKTYEEHKEKIDLYLK